MTPEKTFDPRPFDRTNRAWKAADRLLDADTWTSLEDLRAVMMPAGDLQAKTVSNILGDAVRGGVLQKRAGANKSRYYRIHPKGLAKFAELRRPLPDEPTSTMATPTEGADHE